MADTMALRVSSVVLGSYNWTRDLIYRIYSRTKKVNVVEQELKTQLQRAKEHAFSQEQRVSELSTSLDLEVEENKTLWDQVEYLTNELHRERGWREQQTKACQAERAKCCQEYTQKIRLAKQLEETEKQLAHQKSQEELLVFKEKELSIELETLTASYNELWQEYSNVYQAYSYIQETYDTDLTAEKEKNDTLQQQLEAQTMYHSKKASKQEKEIQWLKVEKEALCQKMEHKTKVAAEREKSLRRELGELNMKLHQETSTNLELVAKIKAEEEEKQVLQKYIVQIMEELKDKASEQREKSPAILQDSELVEEESTAVSQDSELVEEESTAVSQDSELVEEESTAVSQDSELVEEESTAVSQDSELVEEESTAVSQDSELVEEESITVLEDSELQEEADVSEEKAAEKSKRPSFWKRMRHFLGLRKKKKRQKKESTSVCDLNT